MKRRLYEILEVSNPSDKVGRFLNVGIMSLIALNVLAVILETMPAVADKFAVEFKIFELVSVVVFTIEYALRLWACTADNRYSGSISGRLRYSFTAMALIDLLAILPFYLPMMMGLDLRFVRALRLIRIFRVFKIGRYSDSFGTLGDVLRSKKEELLITTFTLLVLLILSSSIMYHIEHEAQSEAFSSIPTTMWWGVVTLTTVGYGDVSPVTPLGKIVGAIIAILGIGMFAMPAGIIASGFAKALGQRTSKCPHCGGMLE